MPSLDQIMHALAPWLAALALVLLYTAVGTMEYADAKAMENEATYRLLADCMNGNAVFKGEDGTEVGCMRAESNRSR